MSGSSLGMGTVAAAVAAVGDEGSRVLLEENDCLFPTKTRDTREQV